MKRHAWLWMSLLVVAALVGCRNEPSPQKINLEKRELGKETTPSPPENTLRIAVGGMITPKAGFGYYRQFLDYLGERLTLNVEFVDRDNYAAINALVKSGGVDAAFVCGGPYVEGHEDFGMELLAAPHAYGGSVYYSYLIVPSKSPVKTFGELRGKRFAFTDPLSNSGALVPTFMLAKMKETPDSFFQSHVFTKSHDTSIKAVAEELVDGAAVDSLIWEYLNRTSPEIASKTKVILKSPPYGIPPVVVRRNLDPRLKRRLQEALLNAHRDEKGKAILRGMMIDRFVLIDDGAYESIREMKRWVAANANAKAGK